MQPEAEGDHAAQSSSSKKKPDDKAFSGVLRLWILKILHDSGILGYPRSQGRTYLGSSRIFQGRRSVAVCRILNINRFFWQKGCVGLQSPLSVEYGVYGDIITIYPKPYSIY